MEMFTYDKWIQCLPSYEEVNNILEGMCGSYTLRYCLENLRKSVDAKLNADCHFRMLEAFGERLWEFIHTGKYCDVSDNVRRAYSLANYLKMIYMLNENIDTRLLEKAVMTLDKIKLLGVSHVYSESDKLHQLLEEYLDEKLHDLLKFDLPELHIEIVPLEQRVCDIPILDQPSTLVFSQNHFVPKKPVLLKNFIKHWPAMKKWRDLNYLLKMGGHRNVPVEIGSHYADKHWSQRLIKFQDFLQRQFGNCSKPNETNKPKEYLAQHELFRQIPSLIKDFCIPELCSLGTEILETDIKAWLGPKDTVSPLHFDEKHNLLCQVFGSKTIILAAPQDSENLYPHESRFLSNTSQIIDIENIDYEKFPAAKDVKFYKVPLIEGSAVYIPPHWWHYVRSDTPSFSVSFWWI